MKTVLFVPGFYEDIDSRDYRSVLKAIETRGYKTKVISINWRRTIVDDWVLELEKIYEELDPKKIILAGFSLGAVTAFVAAAKKNPRAVWLFSLSPYFDDDICLTNPDKQVLRIIGKKRLNAFRKLDINTLTEAIKCPVILFCGDIERKKWPDIGRRSDKAHQALAQSRLVNIPDVGHEIENPKYILAIEKAV